MDQPDPWQVVPRQVITPYDFLLISVAFDVLCYVACNRCVACICHDEMKVYNTVILVIMPP